MSGTRQDSASALVGQRVGGRYRVLAPLGKGGSGLVYRAEDESLSRPVALKLIHPMLAAVPVAVERFRREALVLARLRHANAVHVYDFGTDERTTYIAMELVDGVSLASHIAREHRLAPARVVDIARQVLEVLKVAHQLGIVHRDLKPGNLLLEEVDGREHVRVVDFGTALLLGDQAPRLTREGTIFGTPTYMAPEQCLGKPVDPRTDLYALGCTLYESLVGAPPFDEQGATNVMMAHVHRTPIPPRKLVPDAGIPPALDALVLRALAKLPAQRFPDAQAMLDALDGALDPSERPPAPRRGEKHRPPRAADLPEPADGAEAVDRSAPIAVLEGTRGVGVGTALGALGFTATPIAPGDDASDFALVIVAPGGAAGDGLSAAAAFAAAAPAPVLLCGPEDDLGMMARAIEAGIHDYVPLPLDPVDFSRKVSRALRHRR